MHSLLSSALILSLAASVSALDISKSSDLDGGVWENVSPLESNDLADSPWNHPRKRQSGWNPPSNLATPLKQVWDHCLATYSDGLFGFKNYG